MKKIFRLFAILAMGATLTSCSAFFGSEDQPSGSSTTPTVVHITGVSISGNGIVDATGKMTVGASLQLTPIITPSDTQDTGVKWTSSDPSVVTVSETGLLKALKAGSATIKVISKIDTNIWALVTIIVEEPEDDGGVDDPSDYDDSDDDDGGVNINSDTVSQSVAESR